MVKRIFLDTETTSVNRMTCGVWQIGGIIEVGKRCEEFLLECDIFSEDEVNKEALEMHKLSIEALAAKPDPGRIFGQFQEMLGRFVDKFDKKDKFYFINYGAEFDAEVMRQWWLKNGDDYYGSWFWHPPIDVMVLAMQYLVGRRQEVRNFKLETALEYFKIPYDATKLHDALYDAQKARELYYLVTEKR